MPRLRPRQKDPPMPHLEGVICMESFRPAAVAPLYRKGLQLALDHPVVRAHPEFFRGLVRLEGVENGN